MDTVDTQKDAFGGVDMRTPIEESVIADLLRNFAVAAGKKRLGDAAAMIAKSLVDIGVETYADLRARCRVAAPRASRIYPVRTDKYG